MLREKVEKFAKQMFAGVVMALCVAAVAPAVQAGAVLYESEPNDNPATADQLPLNTWMEGTMKDSYDEDWYTFTVTTPGVTWLEIKPTIENTAYYAKWKVYLQDANRRNLSDFSAHSYTDYKLGLTPGKYYVKVGKDLGTGVDGAYDLMVHNEASSLWEQEQYYGDKTMANANIAYVNNVYSGNLYCSYDVDWYRFKLSGNNKVSVRFTIDDTVADPGTWKVSLIEYNTRKTIETYYVRNNVTLNVDNCSGDLVVKVFNDGYTTGQIYHLQTTATPLSTGSTGTTTPSQVTKPSTGNTTTTTTKVVKPSTTKITSVKAGKRKATIRWKKASKATGYYVYRATKAKGSYKKIATVNGKTSYTDKKSLKSKKKYYYKVVSFRKSGSKITKAKASGVKSVKVK